MIDVIRAKMELVVIHIKLLHIDTVIKLIIDSILAVLRNVTFIPGDPEIV